MKYNIDDVHARAKVTGGCSKTWDRPQLFQLSAKPVKQFPDCGCFASKGFCNPEFGKAKTITLLAGLQSLAADTPPTDNNEVVPAAVTSGFEVNATAQWRATIAVRVKGTSAFGTGGREKLGMLERIPDKGSKVHRSICHTDSMSSDAVGHVKPQRDEVEAVDVLPLLEAAVDLPGIAEETDGVEPELIVKAKRLGFNLRETIVRKHRNR